MNIIFVLTLVVSLLKIDPSMATRLRENSNVLVPSNDESLHEKIKTLLNGDEEIDPEDFSDNEIESLSKANNAEIEKLRHKNLDKVVTKVFDDKNKNIEENLLERNDESFEPIPPPPPLDDEPVNARVPPERPPHPPTPGWPPTHASQNEFTPSFSFPPDFNSTFDSTPSWTPTTNAPNNENRTTDSISVSTLNYTETSWLPVSTTSDNGTLWELTSSTTNSTKYIETTTSYFVGTENATTFNETDITTPVGNTTFISESTTHLPSTPSQNATEMTSTTSSNWTNTETTTSTQSPTITSFNATESATTMHPLGPECMDYFEDSSGIFDPSIVFDECLLGNTERNLKWVTQDGKLNDTLQDVDGVRILDLSRNFGRYCNGNGFDDQFENITYLSAAYNNLTDIPDNLLSKSNLTLMYLSLAGNDFSKFNDSFYKTYQFPELPHLKELDLRNCKLVVLTTALLGKLTSLEAVYLSYNYISTIHNNAFPQSVTYIDLSNNTGGLLAINNSAFEDSRNVQTLDLSFTQLDPTSTSAFTIIKDSTTRLGLCYTELPSSFSLKSFKSIVDLDISGNPQLSLKASFFENFATSLTSLHVRNSNVKDLTWTSHLTSLKLLVLQDNNIHNVSKAFSHMKELEILNLEKNAIGNWYDRLFHENTVLTVLNLRDNRLVSLTDDMIEDMLHVEQLALGKNDFECRCDLEKFMHKLFEATKAAKFEDASKLSSSSEYESIEDDRMDNKLPDSTRPSFGARNYHRPEYDVISRTYQKYYEMAEQSHQALQSRSQYIDQSHHSSDLVLQSKSNAASDDASSVNTILIDYDENDNSYECINVTSKELLKIVEIHDLCMEDKITEEDAEEYKSSKETIFLTLSITLPLILFLGVLLTVAYWKWWYIKYFFVICKNSAILTFMDDSDGDNDAIIKKDDSIDVYLYDVFVSYCEQNREWVLDEFIPNIEKRESINVCLHERDFMVGCGILENIVSCMDRSRCLLLLVSENFLLSQWCQFEMNLAQHRLLETRRDKLIIVLLEDIPVSKQPKTLKYLMRTKTYIKWPGLGSNSEKQLFWKRLKKAITTTKWENDSYGSIA